MQQEQNKQRKLYVGMHDGVCTVMSTDGGADVAAGQDNPFGTRGSPSGSESSRAGLCLPCCV